MIGNCLNAGTTLCSIHRDLCLKLGGLYTFSVALQKTSLVDQADLSMLTPLRDSSSYVALLVIYAITLVATALLSNAACRHLLLAIRCHALRLNQMPILFDTKEVFVACQSFLLPVGYQTNLMVLESG